MPNTATQIGRENAKRQRSGDSVPSVKQWNGTTTSGQRKMPTSIWSLRTLSKSIWKIKAIAYGSIMQLESVVGELKRKVSGLVDELNDV